MPGNSMVKARRLKLGWSQVELAGKCGISSGSVQKAEYGVRLTKDTAEAIGKALGLPARKVSPQGFWEGLPPHKRLHVYNQTILDRRLKLGLTLREVAKRAGIHYLTAGHIENGAQPRGCADTQAAERMLKVLNLPLEAHPMDVSGIHPPRSRSLQREWERALFTRAVSLDEVAGSLSTQDSPERGPDQETVAKAVQAALQKLSFREREILKLRYGLGSGFTYTFEEVGRIFKVTRERIRQLEVKAMGKMVKALRPLDPGKEVA